MRGKAIRQFHQFAAKTTRARSHVTVIVLEKFTQITCFDTREFFFNRKLFILFEVARVGVDLLGKSCMADWKRASRRVTYFSIISVRFTESCHIFKGRRCAIFNWP